MRRREFITLLGSLAAGWPLAARAQQPERMRHIGVLMSVEENNPEGKTQLSRFTQGLAGPKFKTGHCQNQTRPLGVKTGQYRPPMGTCRDRGLIPEHGASGRRSG
jgi:hypothetical protein